MTRMKHRLNFVVAVAALACVVTSGCATGLWKPQQVQPWPVENQNPYATNTPLQAGQTTQPVGTAVQAASNERIQELNTESNSATTNDAGSSSRNTGSTSRNSGSTSSSSGSTSRNSSSNNRGIASPASYFNSQTRLYRGQSPQEAIRIPSEGIGVGTVQQTAAQFPEIQNRLQGDFSPQSGFTGPSINTGSPNEISPLVQPFAPSGNATFPLNYADLDIYLSETNTGRINVGGAFNSDSGIVGQFVIDERNFDIARFPRSFRDIFNGTAWRGGGQNFRLELVPGDDVQRYLVSFSEPFLFNTAVSLSTSLFYFQRQFFDYDEERLGGRVALGYRLTPDLSISAGLRLENVDISDPRVDTSPQLNSVLGDTDLFVGNVSVVRDTRDHPFLPTQGNYTSLTFSQGFGEFDYSRGDIDFRTYRLMYERPDGSGRHTLSYGTKLGFSGSQTPVFENYFAGGFSTLRGFDFRGASPIEGDVRVGGEFQWLNTLEYMFPLTADDMIRGVLFTDFGTVEESIEINSDNFRVAPGFGFRVHLPAAGIGAPLAFDFAFPIDEAAGDDKEVFSFYIGAIR